MNKAILATQYATALLGSAPMNTEQKAREWVAFPSTVNDGRHIIIALLAERKEDKAQLKLCEEDWDRVTVALGLTVHSNPDDLVEKATKLLAKNQALLDALKGIVYEIDWRPAHRAIAMCEESK